jgi:uncharacterized protein
LPHVLELVASSTGTSTTTEEIPTIGSGAAARKFYDSHVFFRREYRSLLGKLVSALPQNVKVRSEASVREVLQSGKDFDLRLGSGESVQTRNLILATGRAGHRFMRVALSSLGAAFHENSADIGIRLEATDGSFSERFFYQPDPKFKFRHGALGNSRTFCSCRGGSVVPVQFGKGFFADGAFLNRPTGVTNVALMVRSQKVLDAESIDSWCDSVNTTNGRTLLLGEVRLSTADTVATNILDTVPLWPSKVHRLLMKELLDNVVGGRHVDMFSWTAAERNVRVYGPCVDLYWPAPLLAEGFRTEVEGLSVIGDATGMSRGILQAMASGAAWALVEVGNAGMYNEHRAMQTDSMAAA